MTKHRGYEIHVVYLDSGWYRVWVPALSIRCDVYCSATQAHAIGREMIDDYLREHGYKPQKTKVEVRT